MIESALKQEDRIKMFTNSVNKLADDKLTDLEWRELKEIKKLLSPFEQLTQYAQEKDSPQDSIMSILSAMDMLLSHLENAKKTSRPTSTAFRTAIETSWAKLDYYYHSTDLVPVYAIAVVLDPRMKLEYFKRNWPADWVTELRRKLRRMFEEENDRMETNILTNAMRKRREERKDTNDMKIDIES